MSAQLELFEDNSPISLMQKEIDLIREQTQNVRRGLFARQTEICQIVVELQDKVKQLESKVNEN